jgi:preprotein translocase subunit SecA
MKKYGVQMSLDHVRTVGIPKLREELVGYQRDFLSGGKIEKTVDDLIAKNPDPESLRRAANERFALKLTEKDFQIRTNPDDNDGPVLSRPATPEEIRELLLNRGRQFLRTELTDLEQFVLIQIFDQTWKDHLYAMDMLKAGIGLLAFAEQDPRIQYKKEGFRFFQEMLSSVRDKVTDLIFRARVVGAAETKSAYKETSAVHESAGGYGVKENVAATAAALGPVGEAGGEMQQAAERTQGTTAVKPIVRDAPKVGRNDLCPCGSGKKYKKCCGANAA